MNREKQYIIIVVILVIIGSFGYKIFIGGKEENILVEVTDIQENVSKRSGENSRKLDINTADYEILREAGLSKTVAEQIVYFQEEWGKIPKIDLLVSRKGIGTKSIEKIKGKFYVSKKDKFLLKKVGINGAHKVFLKYIGLSENDIKKLKSWKRKNGNIFSNTDLMNILSEKKYEKIKNKIIYD